MADRTRIEHLRSLELFSKCSAADVQHIADVAVETSVKAGVRLVDQGSMKREAFVIVRGTADVLRGDAVIAHIGPGSPVGELALLDHGPRTAHVVATSDMELLTIRGEDFEKLLAEIPTLSRALLEYLAHEVRELDREAFDRR